MLSSAVLLLLLAVTYTVSAAPSWDTAEDFALRGAPKAQGTDRDDGIGSLLLKNLRFRDLSDVGKPDGISLLLNDYPALSHAEAIHGVDKRQSIDVSQLARLLNHLKARNIDEDGVKLQSLRFGRK